MVLSTTCSIATAGQRNRKGIDPCKGLNAPYKNKKTKKIKNNSTKAMRSV